MVGTAYTPPWAKSNSDQANAEASSNMIARGARYSKMKFFIVKFTHPVPSPQP